MSKPFRVGDRIGGFCNGYFGRDDYEDKTCVFVSSYFAVFQNRDGHGTLLNYDSLATELRFKRFKPKKERWENWRPS